MHKLLKSSTDKVSQTKLPKEVEMLTAQKDMVNTQRLGQVEQTKLTQAQTAQVTGQLGLINAQTTTESKQSALVEANKLMVDAQRNN